MNCFVIKTPKDSLRLNNVLDQFETQRIDDFTFMDAIMIPDAPRVGIMRSFKLCIQHAKDKHLPWVAIFEDDLKCLSPTAIRDFIELSTGPISKEPFLFLGGFYEGEPVPISNQIARIEGKLSGLHAMIVPEELYDTLLAAEEPYHLDFWVSMIAKIPIYSAYPMLIVQQDGYSYNMNKVTSYTKNLHLKYKLINRQ